MKKIISPFLLVLGPVSLNIATRSILTSVSGPM